MPLTPQTPAKALERKAYLSATTINCSRSRSENKIKTVFKFSWEKKRMVGPMRNLNRSFAALFFGGTSKPESKRRPSHLLLGLLRCRSLIEFRLSSKNDPMQAFNDPKTTAQRTSGTIPNQSGCRPCSRAGLGIAVRRSTVNRRRYSCDDGRTAELNAETFVTDIWTLVSGDLCIVWGLFLDPFFACLYPDTHSHPGGHRSLLDFSRSCGFRASAIGRRRSRIHADLSVRDAENPAGIRRLHGVHVLFRSLRVRWL